MSTKKETEQDLKKALHHIQCLLLQVNQKSSTAKNAQQFLDEKTKRPTFKFLSKPSAWFASKTF